MEAEKISNMFCESKLLKKWISLKSLGLLTKNSKTNAI